MTLQGWSVFSTEKAVKWHDAATGYELWFPLSRSKRGGNTLTVSEQMYKQKVKEWEREERELERQNERDDRQIEKEYQRDLRAIERQFAGSKSESGCAVMLLVFLTTVVVGWVLF